MKLFLALSALAVLLPQEVREERGRYRLTCFGRPAGWEDYRLETFEDGHVVLFSKASWSVEVLAEKREFQVDAVLTMEKSFAPIRYAGYHRSGRQEEIVKVEWQKGVAVADKRKPVRTAAPFVLDHNAVSQLLPVVRSLEGRKRLLVFRPGAFADAELAVADRGDVVLRGRELTVRARERVFTLGPLAITVHTDEKGRILRAWNALQETLAELEGFEDLRPEAATARPEAVEEQDVTFPRGRLMLAGSVTGPKGAGPGPAVLLLGGAGPHDRDGNPCGGTDAPELPGGEPPPPDFLRTLAFELSAAGFRVLRFDDRGCGRSGGERGRIRLRDLAADAAAAAAYLRSRPDAASVAVVGHDEGALVATLMAAGEPAPRKLVLLAAPGRPLDAILLAQAERELRAQGTSEGVTAALLEKERRTFDAVKRSTGDVIEIDERRTFVGWMRDRFREDPAAALRRAAAPAAILHGAKDASIPSDHADLLAAARPGTEVRRLEGLDHYFRGADGRVDPAFLKALVELLAVPAK